VAFPTLWFGKVFERNVRGCYGMNERSCFAAKPTFLYLHKCTLKPYRVAVGSSFDYYKADKCTQKGNKRGRVVEVVSGVQLAGNTVLASRYMHCLRITSPNCCDVAQV
jgi:hypothetical protein